MEEIYILPKLDMLWVHLSALLEFGFLVPTTEFTVTDRVMRKEGAYDPGRSLGFAE
jgi:hypothetical protein